VTSNPVPVRECAKRNVKQFLVFQLYVLLDNLEAFHYTY